MADYWKIVFTSHHNDFLVEQTISQMELIQIVRTFIKILKQFGNLNTFKAKL